MKNNTLTLNDFSHKIYFYYWKKLKKHVFSPKLAWPPATYDIISCNHSNWPPLHLSQNVYKGWMNSYWKCQVLMFYPLGKNSEKPYRGGSPLYVRGLIYWTWAIHRHMKLKSAPENCSKIWEERPMTTNTIPRFVATFCKHVQGARRPNFIGYTHNQGSKQYK